MSYLRSVPPPTNNDNYCVTVDTRCMLVPNSEQRDTNTLNGVALSCNNSGQIFHAHLILSQSDIIFYRPTTGRLMFFGWECSLWPGRK